MEVPLALPWTPLCSDLCKIPGGEEEGGEWGKSHIGSELPKVLFKVLFGHFY